MHDPHRRRACESDRRAMRVCVVAVKAVVGCVSCGVKANFRCVMALPAHPAADGTQPVRIGVYGPKYHPTVSLVGVGMPCVCK